MTTARLSDQPGCLEQGSDGNPPITCYGRQSGWGLLMLPSRLGRHSGDRPGQRVPPLLFPGWVVMDAGKNYKTMKGDIPVVELTRALWGYSTHSKWVDERVGRWEATHYRDTCRSWFAQCLAVWG